MFNRNAIFAGGLRPHHYCLPVLKRERHRLALRRLATGGHPNVFLGTDSAPHLRTLKEAGCGCAGIFNAPCALQSYATVFEEENALDRFEAFASLNGARFHGLAPNEGTITLEREPAAVPEDVELPCGGSIHRSSAAASCPGAWPTLAVPEPVSQDKFLQACRVTPQWPLLPCSVILVP